MSKLTVSAIALALCLGAGACSDPASSSSGGPAASATAPVLEGIIKDNRQAAPPASLYGRLGVVTPRSAAQLRAAGVTSLFSIGTETTDRNFSTYSKWKDYLGPLGIPAARVQTGWADIERTRGVYGYAKLDEIVLGMKSQSVEPWLSLVYGNRLYPGGGTEGLGGGYPVAGTEGRTAWIAFVRETVARYDTPARKVTEWEIWNEPDEAWNPAIPDSEQANKTPEAYADFAVQTALAIKAEQPEAKILLGGFLRILTGRRAFVERAVRRFKAQTQGTIPASDVSINFHPYDDNPDSIYTFDYGQLELLSQETGYALRQGENGAPSEQRPNFAINNFPWTESAQAKFALRRMLNDFRRGIRTNIFTLVDLHYANDLNTKGLLQTTLYQANTPPTNGDQTVTRPKLGYRSVQAAATIFDSRLQLLTNQGCTVPSGYTIHAYTRLDPGNIRRNMLVVWRNTDRPGANEAPADITITCTTFDFPRFRSAGLRPRYVDLVTAEVFELLSATTVRLGAGTPADPRVTITGLRVSDGPILLADQGIAPVTLQ